MIIYYHSYTTTDEKKFLIGYEEGDDSTDGAIVQEAREANIKYNNENREKLKQYKSIISNKLSYPIDLKELYYEQFLLN